MKSHPDFDMRELLEMMRSPETEAPKKIGAPTTDQEAAEAKVHMIEIAQNPDHIRVICIGCSADVPVLTATACVCGGFVCGPCREREGDDDCTHEPPDHYED